MYFIACDPSTKESAFAVYYNGELLCSSKVNTTIKDLEEFFESFENDFSLIIEGQFRGPNSQTLIKLGESRAMIALVAYYSGCTFQYQSIEPSKWGKILSRNKMIRSERKEKAKEIAKKELKMKSNEKMDEDIADAICIAKYVISTYEDDSEFPSIPIDERYTNDKR